MTQKKYHLLYKGSQILVLALTNALNSENINPIIKDQGESARLAGFGTPNPLL